MKIEKENRRILKKKKIYLSEKIKIYYTGKMLDLV